MKRVAQFLALACAVTLTLPQGWCCLVAIALSSLTANSTAEAAPDCCKCAKCSDTPSRPRNPADLPLGSDRCPCYDRQAVLVNVATAENDRSDSALVAAVPVPNAPLIFRGADGDAVCVVHPPTCRLNVLQCVWRC
jgi:hypothetical protein